MNGQPSPRALPRHPTVTYRLHGPGDYFYCARLEPDGRFRIDRGTFHSAPPRIGRVEGDTRIWVDLLLVRLAPLSSWSFGPPVEAFESELILGGDCKPRTFRWSVNSVGVPRALLTLAEVLRDL